MQMVGFGALYPVYGLIFITRHSMLWKRMLNNVAHFAGLSSLFLLLHYTVGWRLQKSMLVPIFGRGWATQGALQMLLAGEAVLGLFFLMKSLLSAGADDVFDEVMALRGVKEIAPMAADERAALQAAARAGTLAEEGSARQGTMTSWVMGLPLRAVYRVGSHYASVVTTPLLAIPIVGWVAYFIINGKMSSADVHKHYFERKGVTDLRQQELIRNEHKTQYMGFGMVAFLFNLAPVVNYGLFYANVAGAALWAADIEEGRAKMFTGGRRVDDKKSRDKSTSLRK